MEYDDEYHAEFVSAHGWLESIELNSIDLSGAKVLAIEGCEVGSEAICIRTDRGDLLFAHEQICCESVSVEDVDGDPSLMVGWELESCYVSSSPMDENDSHGSMTWTFYRVVGELETLTIRWLGESNGCYSEEVDVYWNPREK